MGGRATDEDGAALAEVAGLMGGHRWAAGR